MDALRASAHGMSRVLAVVGETTDPTIPAKARLLEAARRSGHNLVFYDAALRGPTGAPPLAEAGAILIRGGAQLPQSALDGVAALGAAGTPLVNSPDGVRAAANKIVTAELLTAARVPQPRARTLNGPEDVAEAIRELGLPTVLKLPTGSQGKGVNILSSQQQVEQVTDTIWALHAHYQKAGRGSPGMDPRVLAQEFLTTAGGSDTRALVVRHPDGTPRLVAAMERRAPEGSLRSNLHQGGEGIPATLTPDQARQAEAAADALGLDVAGVDLIKAPQSPTGMYVVEVNSSPGGSIETITGAPIADRIIDRMASVARS